MLRLCDRQRIAGAGEGSGRGTPWLVTLPWSNAGGRDPGVSPRNIRYTPKLHAVCFPSRYARLRSRQTVSICKNMKYSKDPAGG